MVTFPCDYVERDIIAQITPLSDYQTAEIRLMIYWYNLPCEAQWKIIEEEMTSFPIQAIMAAIS